MQGLPIPRRRVSTALAIAGWLVAGCKQEAPREPSVANQAIEEPPPRPLPPPGPLDRETLLIAIAHAASDHAAGVDDLQAQRTLEGRRFEVRLRFGCGPPGLVAGASGWSFDRDSRKLHIRAVPSLTLDDPLVRTIGRGAEAAEGFWLARPWLLTAVCPAARDAAPDPVDTPTDEAREAQEAEPAPRFARVGLAQFYTETDARTRRRSDRPYEVTQVLAEGDELGEEGFNLILSGRLRALGAGRVIHCRGASPDAPPDCIVSSDIDRVWIERPQDQSVIAEWAS